MVDLTPLTIRRVENHIECKPNERKTIENALHLLEQINNSTLPFFLYSGVSDIASYLSLKDTRDSTKKLVISYHRLLRSFLHSCDIGTVDRLTEDSITFFYDKLLSESETSTNIPTTNGDGEEYEKQHYRKIYDTLTQRDIALWAITGNVQSIQSDIVASLYSINPDLLSHHDRHKLKHIRDRLAYKWGDLTVINQWRYILDKCNSILQAYEIDGLKVDLDHHTGGELSKTHGLSESESAAYWDIRWWLLYALFLVGNYSMVVEGFTDLTVGKTTMKGICGDSIGALNKLDTTVIDKSSLIRIVVISVLLSENNLVAERFLSNPLVMEGLYDDPLLKQFRENVEIQEFPEVRKQLKLLEQQLPWCEPLNGEFGKITSLFLHRTFVAYLSFVERISISELSDKFAMEKTEMLDFVIKITTLLDLPLFIDKTSGIVSHKKNTDNVSDDFIESIHEATNNESIRLKTIKLNNILNSLAFSKIQDTVCDNL